ncbi:MAG: TIGR03984 family CRISPR-associated protein [Gemmataceae bacterium]|nr:TIGR03984 family CRISPR-associated protein [Gemmataceae bacterium]
MNGKLFIYTRQAVSLSEAMEGYRSGAGSERATAILYSPQRCLLAAWESGQFQGHAGQSIDTASVFEVRVFNETAELRWQSDAGPKQRQRAVILTEQDISKSLGATWLSRDQDCDDKLHQTYLLWGQGTGTTMAPGWSELATARIGKLAVPLNGVGRNQRVLLKSIEYLAAEKQHGNVTVLDERLVKIGDEQTILAEIKREEAAHG